MDRVWFLTWTTYGTWLPGDVRGFVSSVAGEGGTGVRHNTPGTECDADLPPLRHYMQGQLRGEPIWLTPEHAELLPPQFRETAAYRGWTLFITAVMANHVHVVVGVPGDPDPSDLLRDLKSYASRPLNRRRGKPASETWWTESGSKRKVPDRAALFNVVKYVRDQYNPLVVWLNADAIRAHLDPAQADELLASGGRQPPVGTHCGPAVGANRGLTPPARQPHYVEAPAEYAGPGPSLFLAGGISGTHDWQAEAARLLADLPLAVLNPRRTDYPWHDPAAAAAQIAWEFRHLRRATAVLFWFPPETLCPIALFELGGRSAAGGQPLFVGTHPAYARRPDVEIQLRLARPEVKVVSDIPTLAGQVRDWFTEHGAS